MGVVLHKVKDPETWSKCEKLLLVTKEDFFFLLIIVDICGPLLLSFISLKTQNIITNQEYKLSSLAVKVERVFGSGDLSDIQPLRWQLSPLRGILYL